MHNLKCLLSFLLIITSYIELNAQRTTKNNNNYSIASILSSKVYTEELYISDPEFQDRTTTIATSNYLSYGFNFQRLNKNLWFYEFSLINVSLNQNTAIWETRTQDPLIEPVGGGTIKSFLFSSRAEAGKYVFSKKNRVNLGLSFGINLYYFSHRMNPRIVHPWPLKISRIGIIPQVIPRISFRINNRISTELSSAPELVNFFFERGQILNPNVSTQNQKTKGFYKRSNYNLSLSLILRIRLK